MGRLFRWLFALGVLAVLAAVCAVVLLLAITGQSPGEAVRSMLARLAIAGRDDDLNTPIGTDETPRRFTVDLGDTPAVIGGNLFVAGFIRDPDLFVNYTRAEGLDRELEAGTYFLRETQTLAQIAAQLTDSRGSFIPFRIIEGWRLEQIAEVIDSNPLFAFTGADFLEAVGPPVDLAFSSAVGLPQGGVNLEGFLFPNTYQLPPDITPDELRDALTAEFLLQTGDQLRLDAAEQGLSLYEVVTLASIVQREAVHEDEMPMIAGVYRNRLDIGMLMEADPTVQYPLGRSRGEWWAQITAADYTAVISPYNTYLNRGLPPGPIANPGIEAMRAAVYPQESEFYYFRADCREDGYHDFAITFEDHLANGC